jgi:hypothetical protein
MTRSAQLQAGARDADRMALALALAAFVMELVLARPGLAGHGF